MQFTSTRRHGGKSSRTTKAPNEQFGPPSFYSKPPLCEVTLDEFKEAALLRLKVLRLIEQEKGKGKTREEIDVILEGKHKIFFETYFGKADKLSNVRLDQLSHFILRLAYCQSESLRQLFLMVESELFRFRFQKASPRSQRMFFLENNLDFEPISPDEKGKLNKWALHQISHTSGGEEAKQPQQSKQSDGFDDFYKIPFEEALRLVGRRQVYLEDGCVYCPKRLMFEIIVGRFRARLAREMAVAYRSTQNQVRDKRVHPWLFQLVNQYLGPKVKAAFGGAVTLTELPLLAKTSFPLCMRNSYDRLKKEHHLKNGGRMHFGLFLKGIGLSLPDSLTFFRTHFNPKTPPQKFAKNYAYTIKHQHGAVGNKTSYSPFGCMKIINTVAGAGDHCGCPYKKFGEDQLLVYLRKQGINEGAVREISGLAKDSHYQIACMKFFKVTHSGCEPDDVGNHPNAYFEESFKYHNASAAAVEIKKDDGPSKKDTRQSSQSSYSSQSSTPLKRVSQ